MLQQAFNNYSAAYDEHFTNTPIGRLQRRRVHYYIKPLLNNWKHVLELNCGTGEDADYISRYVKTIDATDLSQRMIEVAKLKCKQPNITFRVCSIQNLQSFAKSKSY